MSKAMISCMASIVFCIMPLAGTLAAADASSHLGNNQRTGHTGETVPASPVLKWTYLEKHPPRHAWKEPNREVQYIDFDYATQTTIANGMVLFGSSADHKVYALDVATGEQKWSLITEGPVRFAPVVYEDRVYVASDDGFLYCIEAPSGKLSWKFRGGPAAKKSIGNEQMISHWPARSGVLIEGDQLFFTAGMWSRDGVFIYCLDPQDASILWKNDTSGYHFATLPHSTGYAGVAPQGYLALHRDRLYVPTGRGAPACFDAKTGAFIFYENGHGYKPHQPGGSRVMAWRDWVVMKRRSQHTEESVRYEERGPAKGAASGLYALDFETGKPAWSLTDRNIVAAHGNTMILGGAGPVIKVDISEVLEGYEKFWKDGKHLGHDPNIPDAEVAYTKSGQGKLIPSPAWMSPLPYKKWSADVGRVFVLMQAGETILAGGREVVSAIDSKSGRVLWQKKIEGDARGITVADGRFIVSSTAGNLYCFGEGESDSSRRITHRIVKPTTDAKSTSRAASVLETSGVRAGYALMLGAGDGQLLCELLNQSELVIYCLEPDEAKASRAQKILDGAGLLGVRAAVHRGTFDELPYSPYFANLVLCGTELGSGTEYVDAAEIYRVLRPHGGVAIQLGGGKSDVSTRRFLTDGGVPDAEISTSAAGLVVKRGKLPDAGQWTHAHANIGRTGCSQDARTRLPLGMLWWGGPGPARIVSRHWRAPSPVFANGVLFVQGQHDVFAIDAYNGREMWNRHLNGVGRFPPTHRGGNIVADEEGVYCVQGLKCLKLDAQTGKTVREYVFPLGKEHARAMASLPPNRGELPDDSRIVWEYLGLIGDRIVGTLGVEPLLEESGALPFSKNIPQSKYVFLFDKATGRMAWLRELEHSVSPTAIVADQRALYLLDRDSSADQDRAKRRGDAPAIESSLKALDLASGKTLWIREKIPAPWKALMLSEGCIVAYPNPAENAAHDGDQGVGVYSNEGGRLLWKLDELEGVAETGRGGTMRHTFIVGDTLFLPWAFDLRTGKEKFLEKNPLTGARERFNVSGKNFCGTFAAAENLLTYRSASIGFAEIDQDSGSHWLPETRPSCWISAIPAGGMVLVPESYSTCICPYNYKTSIAMIPVQRHENWSVYLEGGRRDKMARNKARLAANKARLAARKRGKNAVVAPNETPIDVRHLRLNLNAPGDQLDDNGNMWLAWPRPVDPKTVYQIQPVPVEQDVPCKAFRFNADYHPIDGTQDPWLYTSGLEGPASFRLVLSDNVTREYTVRLHFAETRYATPGERVFDVKIQGKTVLAGLDIAKEAGGPNKAVIKEIANVSAKGPMEIQLSPSRGEPPLLCSVEVVEQ